MLRMQSLQMGCLVEEQSCGPAWVLYKNTDVEIINRRVLDVEPDEV